MSTDEYVPSEANVRAAYVLAGIPDNASPDLIKRAERRAGPEFDRFLARVREEQREIDLAMHYAYRPEVVAEVAVCLDDDVDWDRIATWCGARIDTGQDPSGEYTSVLALPDGQVAARGMWIVKRLDGTFGARAEVAEPDASTLARVRRDAAREVGQYIKRLHPNGLTAKKAVLADIDIAADRMGRGIHANGRDRETP